MKRFITGCIACYVLYIGALTYVAWKAGQWVIHVLAANGVKGL